MSKKFECRSSFPEPSLSHPDPDVSLRTSMRCSYSHPNARSRILPLFALARRSSDVGGDCAALNALVEKLGLSSDSFVRNALLCWYCRHGPFELAKKVFDEMPKKTIADFNAMISGFWRAGDVAGAKGVFDGMGARNVVTWTAMVTGYSRFGDLVMARRVFDEIPVKNVVSWNAMLSGYAQSGMVEDCLGLFRVMMDGGVRSDETTWVTVISACSSYGCLQFAERFLASLHKRPLLLNAYVATALIDLYAKCGDLVAARKFFDVIEDRSVASWNAFISGYVKHGDMVSAKELFDAMPKKDVISWNTMIAGFAQSGQSAEAVELFKEMAERGEGLKPDELTVASVLSACGHIGALQLGRWAVNFIMKNRVKITTSGYNALIYIYAKCGDMGEARRAFNIMPVRDLVSYNSLIGGFAAHGHGHDALNLMLEMKKEGIESDRITFIGILTACSHAGLEEEGKNIFNSIKHPTVDHYACMIDLLGRSGKLDDAKSLLDKMPMTPHAGVYGTILNASCIHKKTELGEFAASKLFELEPENSGNYVLLSNIYAAASRWDDVNRVRKMMAERGVKKVSGWSWIEVARTMHRFISGDKSHPRTGEIYTILEGLRKRMRNLGYVADKRCVLRDIEEEEKEEMVGAHSEKLAIAFGLLVGELGGVIRVVKNLRVCSDCHHAIKVMSKLERKEIIIRDNNRFHHFKNGECSCKDFW